MQSTSTPGTIISQMICLVTICPPSCPRYPKPIGIQPPHPVTSWTSCSIHRQIGPLQPGPSVQRYFQDGLAPSTQKTYAAALRRFHTICLKFNVGSPFPVSEHMLCCFASFLADQGLAPQTGKGYLSAIQSMQISLGLPDPREQSSLPLLKRVQAGISQVHARKGTLARIHLPITAHVLEQIGRKLRNSANSHKVPLWAIACTAFFGFFRLGELLPESPNGANPAMSLVWGDIAADNRENPTMVCVHLKKSISLGEELTSS